MLNYNLFLFGFALILFQNHVNCDDDEMPEAEPDKKFETKAHRSYGTYYYKLPTTPQKPAWKPSKYTFN
jgi:hypothetical protein